MAQEQQIVRHFCHMLLWPLQLELASDRLGTGRPWEILRTDGNEAIWKQLDDPLSSDAADFRERHYSEFVTFLPYVQRFLYGEARSSMAAKSVPKPAAMRVFQRNDVAALRITVWPEQPPITLSVTRISLFFFRDIDVVLFGVELHAQELPLSTVMELLYRFGRAYPASWHRSGQGMHNVYRAEWLDAKGSVLARSNTEVREDYMQFVRTHHAPRLAAHWAYLLRPLVQDVSDEPGPLRFRQIEYHRMPLMAYLALDNPRALAREDFIRLGLISYLRPGDALSFREPAVSEFESRYCIDRYWMDTDEGPNSRIICTGHALITIGETQSAFFQDAERGMLASFRHQYFLTFLIAHFHRSALLVFSDRLAAAVNDLDIADTESVRRFKRRIRIHFATFLRFTHRYWFNELSERGQTQTLFTRMKVQLGNDTLFEQVKERVREMSHYLDSDSQRRQSNTVLRLTVVTVFGLIATVATGFLGMNLLAAAEDPFINRLSYFLLVTGGATAATFYAVARSKQLWDFLEALSDERLTWADKFKALVRGFFSPVRPD